MAEDMNPVLSLVRDIKIQVRMARLHDMPDDAIRAGWLGASEVVVSGRQDIATAARRAIEDALAEPRPDPGDREAIEDAYLDMVDKLDEDDED